MTRFSIVLAIVILLCSPGVGASCEQWPAGTSFVGLVGQQWKVFIVSESGGMPKEVDLKGDPRTPVLEQRTKRIFYVDEADLVNAYSLKSQSQEVLLNPSDEEKFGQPHYDIKNGSIYLVKFKEGNSVDTDIVRVKPGVAGSEVVLAQRSAQFDPYLKDGFLYYSNVHCVAGCGRIIQEVWRLNLVSGQAKQLTLLGAISRQPSVGNNGQWLYFSSNKMGRYHIYKQSLSSQEVVQVTNGESTDVSPVVVEDSLYFVRHEKQKDQIICLNKKNSLSEMEAPERVTKIKDLEISK